MELVNRICLRTSFNKEMQREIKDEKETLISVIKKNSFHRCNKRKRKKRDFKTVYLDGYILTLNEINMCHLERTKRTKVVEPEKLSLKFSK